MACSLLLCCRQVLFSNALARRLPPNAATLVLDADDLQ